MEFKQTIIKHLMMNNNTELVHYTVQSNDDDTMLTIKSNHHKMRTIITIQAYTDNMSNNDDENMEYAHVHAVLFTVEIPVSIISVNGFTDYKDDDYTIIDYRNSAYVSNVNDDDDVNMSESLLKHLMRISNILNANLAFMNAYDAYTRAFNNKIAFSSRIRDSHDKLIEAGNQLIMSINNLRRLSI